jgi:hypothetical protein
MILMTPMPFWTLILESDTLLNDFDAWYQCLPLLTSSCPLLLYGLRKIKPKLLEQTTFQEGSIRPCGKHRHDWSATY